MQRKCNRSNLVHDGLQTNSTEHALLLHTASAWLCLPHICCSSCLYVSVLQLITSLSSSGTILPYSNSLFKNIYIIFSNSEKDRTSHNVTFFFIYKIFMHSVNGNSFTAYIFNVVLYANLLDLKIYRTSVNPNKQGKNTVAVRWVKIPKEKWYERFRSGFKNSQTMFYFASA